MTGVWTPQWLYRHITIDADETIRLDPGAFMNNEPWPLHLKWMSLAGSTIIDDSGDFSTYEGGVTRRLQFEFSMTGKGDISAEWCNGHTVLADGQPVIYGRASRYDFSPAFPLGPEEGINAEYVNIDGIDNLDSQSPGIMFIGLRKERKFNGFVPAHLAAHYHNAVGFNDSVTMPSTDLYNNGEEPIWLRQMLVGCHSPAQASISTTLEITEKSRAAWRVNPNSGVQWMPNPEPIPVGNLAPFTVHPFDFAGWGPTAWVFPKGCVLRPRQRFGIKLRNLADKTQQFGLCLHGIMEVK